MSRVGLVAVVLSFLVAVCGCGMDDGAAVRQEGDPAPTNTSSTDSVPADSGSPTPVDRPSTPASR